MPKSNPFRLFRITHKDKADRDYDRYRYSNYPREKMGKMSTIATMPYNRTEMPHSATIASGRR